MDGRLPAHLEVAALLRQTQVDGGFATVVQKGEKQAGTIVVVVCSNGTNARAYERMPQLDGTSKWHRSKTEAIDNKHEFQDYLTRRGLQDPDLWIIELDIANGERLIGLSPDFT